ncbi:hypothetical protein BDV12DRAFT_100315 [Aspergillus spectabilis]
MSYRHSTHFFLSSPPFSFLLLFRLEGVGEIEVLILSWVMFCIFAFALSVIQTFHLPHTAPELLRT